MAGDQYYLMSVLPGLGDLGSPPPMPLSRLIEQVIDSGGNVSLIESILLSDDLLQRQSFLSGEKDELNLTVLSVSQARNEEPLPEYLATSSEDSISQSSLDAVWELYYRYAVSVASAKNSSFLRQWVEYEVGLKNALVTARAKALNLDPQEYLVAEELGGVQEDYSHLINEWVSVSDPVAGLQVLDTARWQWLWDNDGWFAFEDDELAAYGAKLMLIQRWYRLGEGQN